jgi:hypothetical protein
MNVALSKCLSVCLSNSAGSYHSKPKIGTCNHDAGSRDESLTGVTVAQGDLQKDSAEIVRGTKSETLNHEPAGKLKRQQSLSGDGTPN